MPAWRLLVVSEPGRDGVFYCVSSLIRHLHDRHPEIGVDFAYSSLRSGPTLGALVREVEDQGGETIDLRVGNAPQSGDLRAAAQIFALTRRKGTRLVHAHSSKAGGLVRLCACAPTFPPVLYTPHAYYGMQRSGGAKEWVFNAIEAILGHIGTTHNCSRDERDFAFDKLRVPAKRLAVIHHGIDLAAYAPADAAQRALARRALGLPEQGKLLITIGRDSPQKNFAPLYAALTELLPTAGWSFAHAGAGSAELCRGLPVDRSFAFSYLEDTSQLLRAADGFILTSRYEGLSISVLHALACGLPLFLTQAPGLLALGAMGFSDICWLPAAAGDANLTTAVRAALTRWANEPACPPLASQRALASELFDGATQMERLVNLCSRIAVSQIPAGHL